MPTETVACFDLDGTLIRFDGPYDEYVEAAFEEHLGHAADAVVRAYNEGFHEAFEALEPEPYHAGVRAALARADGAGGDATADPADVDVDAVVASLREREVAGSTATDAVRECLADLAAAGATRVAVVTDGVGDWQRDKLARVGLAEHVDETVASYDVGGHKESGRPYEAVRERLDGDEYVMVGDDYAADVEAAREAGFVPIHYEDAETDLFAVLRAML